MNYNYNNLTGAILLRADSHSQITKIETDTSEKELITEEQFWGDGEKTGLYYHYESDDNASGYTTSSEGWDDYTENSTEKMSIEQTKEWIEKNILSPINTNLCVIQGYAGCGKTTFVHSILRKAKSINPDLKYHNFYIGHVKNTTENTFITSSIRTKIVEQIIVTLQDEDGMQVYNSFVELWKNDLSTLNPDLSVHFAPIFYSETNASLYRMAKNIYEHRYNNDIEKQIKNYRVQFNCSLNAVLSKVRYNEKTFKSRNSCNELVDVLLFIYYIWVCAVFLTRDKREDVNQILVYDNLDIIENHVVVADFIDKLRSVLVNYSVFKNTIDKPLPTFKVILTVRKITYASISRFVEVSNNQMGQSPTAVDFLDISNLYISSNVLKHKARVLLNSIEKFVPSKALCYNSIVSFLEEIINTPEDVFSDIKFSELLNHNLRACANMMEKVVACRFYKKYISKNPKPSKFITKKFRSSIWIHSLCTILKENNILDSLGYNLSDSKELIYPTTLSRMILTYLSNRRLGCMRGIGGFISPDVSFKEMVLQFKKIPFVKCHYQIHWGEEIKDKLKNNYNEVSSQEKIVQCISEMLQRNNSIEESELWRRPIYYTNNAFPLIDSKTIEQTLFRQIKKFSNPKAPITSFCITDEGYTFVERIATHFESYSVRFNNKDAEPISGITDHRKLERIIQRVYDQVKQCVNKQIWLMDYYTKKYSVNENEYLNELFHPRTERFYPQLHVVRTIYDHIGYLNDYRDYLYQMCDDYTENYSLLNKCLVRWIGEYLELYRRYLYNKLESTDGHYNNSIWLDLKYLYWLVYKDDKNIGAKFNDDDSKTYITINRKSTISRAKQKEAKYNGFRISDDELLNQAMLII